MKFLIILVALKSIGLSLSNEESGDIDYTKLKFKVAKAVRISPENVFKNNASKSVPVLLTSPSLDTVALAIFLVIVRVYRLLIHDVKVLSDVSGTFNLQINSAKSQNGSEVS